MIRGWSHNRPKSAVAGASIEDHRPAVAVAVGLAVTRSRSAERRALLTLTALPYLPVIGDEIRSLASGIS